MHVHPVFRQIQRRDTVCGLEILDLFILLVLIGTILMFTDRIGLVLFMAPIFYLILYFAKHGKPEKHTWYWLKFHMEPKPFAAPDGKQNGGVRQ